ncbi:hypothetical protein OG562_15800 [Streptomyces sp. NBC_01275]|uniref:hypothetical protein n=1 Tax=Streptomyces sp. NBC_01275 TaxID=2903807 RepID=UPI002252E925|nr:hypothetical protein [Streptomyces sp. NBC_01275]MCX4762413.1 hypothetical protein [Streptomyces sp. NBC_01275]
MRSLKVTLCAGAAVAVATLAPTVCTAPMAHAANGGGSVTVTPSTPSPGVEVALRVSGCGGRTATAASEAFVADATLVSAGGTGGTGDAGGALVGETRVRSSIEPGSYDVRITCVDFQVKGRIKVVAAASSQSSRPSQSPQPYEPTAPASPVAPVHAGGGGAAPLAVVDEARAEGPGTAQAVTGLVLAGVAATVVAFRSARRSRRTG